MARNDTSDRALRAPLHCVWRGLAFAALAFVALLAAGCVQTPRRADADAVRALADAYLAAILDRYPETVTYYGLAGPQDRLTDNSLEALAVWESKEDAFLTRLRSLARPAPGGAGWVAYGIMREALEASVEARVCRIELWHVSEADGWHTTIPYLAEIQPVETPQERTDALARIRALGPYLDQEIVNLREGLRLGYSAPKGNVRIVIGEVRGLLAPDSPLASPARRAGVAGFESAYRSALENRVQPALRRYIEFLEKEYLPAARDAIAVSANPNGARCYAAAVRYHSTLHVPARRINAIGLQQVAKIREEMRVIGARTFGTEDVTALLETLRTDPQYQMFSRTEIVRYAQAALGRAQAAVPMWFGLVPRAGVRIEAYPAYREASGTGEYQSSSEDGTRPGTFYIPTSSPTRRPRAGQESLCFHETVPGHHLQGAIALERGDRLHPLARYVYSSGYAEGWALYAERLADEMGLYSADLDRLGMLSDQAARAARLVVDTGMHALGWTRQQAIDYMLANTIWSKGDVEAEVDRYIVWPGQATAYMLGMLEIMRLRAEAQEKLGERFDIRAFHDRVLEDGSVSLPMLADKIDYWIEGLRARPAP
jgi:uncharacterized protein (DUF885 family)